MKTRGCIKTLLLMSVILMCLSLLNQAHGQESVKITQDQFELRSDPENNDENVIGTLRLNTPVVLTGKTSGQWREVRAPNGQTGWVHEAGLALPKRTEKPAPTPKPEQTKPPKRATPKPAKTQAATSRTVPRSQDAQPDKPAKTTGKVDELQKANSQYKAQLDEKERRIAELTTELEAVEAKLAEAGQSLSDAEQQSKLGEVKFKEIQAQIDALNETMKQKEEELLTEKVEKTKLQEQINTLAATPPSSLQRTLLLVSLPLNLLAVLLLGYFGVRHIARKQEKQLIEESESHVEHVAPIAPAPEPKRQPEAAAPQPADSVKIQISKEPDPGLHELDVVMTTPEKAAAPVEPSEAVEEVVIDLGDVLPGAKPAAAVPQAAPALPHKKTEPIAKPVEAEEEIIIVDEPIEPVLPEAAAPLQIEPAEAVLIEEEIEETQIEEPAAPAQEAEMEEALLEELDEPLAPGYQAEIEPPAPAPVHAPVATFLDEELDDIPMTPIESEVEEPAEPLQIEEEMGALEMELEDEELDLSAETPVSEAIEETDEEPVELDGDLDALLENTPKLDHSASVEDVLEEGELEELPPQEVEIDGERFETIPKKHTQPIEIAEQEEEMFDETPAESAPVEEEASEMEEILLDSGPGVIDEPLPETETGVSKSIVRDEASAPRPANAESEAAEPSFANLRANQEIDELISMFGERHPERPEKRSESRLHPSRRRFAEPSPHLIEPEHETEAVETERHSGKCTIELVQVGKNREHILHILSKIQGLAKSPEELIASTPCTLARGAEKQDAQNFQMLMQKFGAEVRVIER